MSTNPGRVPLSVFAAGSLIVPFDALEEPFEARFPDVDLLAEYHGSIQVIRHATELQEPIDVVATADASLIPMLMYNVSDPRTGKPYASWTIRWATNRLGIAYSPESLYSDQINSANWPSILARKDVKVGIADPRFDASGYRALMAFALAEEAAGQYTYFGPMFGDQFSAPLTIFREEDLTAITVPEVLEAVPGSHIVLRGASIQLIALLESGDLDYAFEYESVIRQHGLQMLQLPDAVNLGAEDLEEIYRRVEVTLDFQRFASVKPVFRGERIAYGITIPSSAPHPAEAAEFIAFLLGPEGRAIMWAHQHPLLDAPVADAYGVLPPSLQALVSPSEWP